MNVNTTLGKIIILNGAPRSGKSSIVAAIQESFAGVWMNLGVDCFMQITPARYRPGIGLRPGGERPELEPLLPVLYAALYESIAVHSRLGLNVVADVGHHNAYSTPLNMLPQCARILTGLPALFVGVHCPPEVIVERRQRAGWSAGQPVDMQAVLLWQREVHRPGLYDLDLDTSQLSPQECADRIRRRMEQWPTPSAFQQLASLLKN